MSLNDIGNLAVFAWNHDGNDGAAIVSNGNFVAVFVDERVEVCFLAFDFFLEVFGFQTAQFWLNSAHTRLKIYFKLIY